MNRMNRLPMMVVIVGLSPLAGVLAVEKDAPPPTPVRATGSFDQGMVAHYRDDFVAYFAVRDLLAEGPLMERAGQDVTPANINPSAQAVRDSMDKLKKRAIEEKIIEQDLRELFPRGFSAGVRPPEKKDDEPMMLFVVPQSDPLRKFYDLLLDDYTKREGKDGVVNVDVGGSKPAVVLTRITERNPPVLLPEPEYLYLASHPDLIKEALVTRKTSEGTLAMTRAYKKSRESVRDDVVGYMLLAPRLFLEAVARSEKDELRKEKYLEALDVSQAFDAVLVQLMARPGQTQILMSVLLNAKHPKFARVKDYLPRSGVSSPGVVPDSSSVFLSFLRPQAPDMAEGTQDPQQQKLLGMFKSVQGMLQMQAGLRYEQDVAPWLGSEIGLVGTMTESGAPELAVLVATKDAAASEKALRKVVNHLTYTKNQRFNEIQVDGHVIQAAIASPQSPNFAPALTQIPGFIVVGSGSQIVTALFKVGAPMSRSRGFDLLKTSVDAEKMPFILQMKTDLLARLPQVSPDNPQQSAGTEALRQLSEKLEAILMAAGLAGNEALNLSLIFLGK